MGDRQRQILTLVIAAGEDGIDTGTIAREIGDITQPNVHLTLKALMNRGLVEKDPSRRPHLYYVSTALRS